MAVKRYPGTVHLIPGHPVMPVCTGDDCPVCDAKDALEQNPPPRFDWR